MLDIQVSLLATLFVLLFSVVGYRRVLFLVGVVEVRKKPAARGGDCGLAESANRLSAAGICCLFPVLQCLNKLGRCEGVAVKSVTVDSSHEQ